MKVAFLQAPETEEDKRKHREKTKKVMAMIALGLLGATAAGGMHYAGTLKNRREEANSEKFKLLEKERKNVNKEITMQNEAEDKRYRQEAEAWLKNGGPRPKFPNTTPLLTRFDSINKLRENPPPISVTPSWGTVLSAILGGAGGAGLGYGAASLGNAVARYNDVDPLLLQIATEQRGKKKKKKSTV